MPEMEERHDTKSQLVLKNEKLRWID